MSRGLGWLQREILASLEASKEAVFAYRGSGRDRFFDDPPGWVTVKGATVRLADNVFDLRACLKYLAKKHGHTYSSFVEPAFQAAFSRAATGLVKHNLLVPVDLVRITDIRGDRQKYLTLNSLHES